MLEDNNATICVNKVSNLKEAEKMFYSPESKINVWLNESGCYTVDVPGFTLEGCSTAMEVDGTKYPLNWQRADRCAELPLLTCCNEVGNWTLEFSHTCNFGGVRGLEIKFRGRLKRASSHVRLTLLSLPQLNCDHVLAQGVKMGGCLSRQLPVAEPVSFHGYYQLMLTRYGRHLQLAFPLRQSQPARFEAELAGEYVNRLTAQITVSHYDGLTIEAPLLTIFTSENGFKLMEDWANDNAETQKSFDHIAQAGWSTWDYYRWTITEEEVLKNAEFIANDPILSRHVKRIIIDDGWQYCYGEWDANSLFKNGMAALAKELTRMGFEPGLWFAPTVIEPHSRIAQWDSDMLAQGESGAPCMVFNCMYRHGFVLDPTTKKVNHFLHDLFRRYVEMGYRYFKLDFMHAPLLARKFADRTIPHSEIIRCSMEPIHKALNGKAQILGCNYRFEAGTRYVDAVRIGSDIHAKWENIAGNAVTVAARFCTNKRLWLNDPDFALCRGVETAADPDLQRLNPMLVFIKPDDVDVKHRLESLTSASRAQLEILLSVALMSAGAINLSDNLPRLNESGLDLARRVVSAAPGETAIPLDLFESEQPSCWLQKLDSGHRLLLINWTEVAEECEFDLKKHAIDFSKVKNFWNDEPIQIHGNRFSTILSPQSCLLLEISV